MFRLLFRKQFHRPGVASRFQAGTASAARLAPQRDVFIRAIPRKYFNGKDTCFYAPIIANL
jgi:hypothetical protein